MSREEEIAKIDEELEKLGLAEEVEADEVEPEVEEEPQEVVEAPKEEPVAAPEVVEPKPPVKLEINSETVPESKAWYLAREATRRAEALEKQLAERDAPKAPNKEENYEGFIEHELGMTKAELAELKAWKNQQEQEKHLNQQRDGAFEELRGYEADAAQAYPDFTEASNYAKSMIAASIKLLQPNISPTELAQQTLYKYAEQAAIALNSKKHPGQAIYENAQAWGYKKPEAPKIEIVQDNKPSLAKIAENKKKSSGMTNSGSSGKNEIGNQELLGMTNAQRMKLTEADWARLEQEA